jgi:secreted PhoX family phosphatase
LSATRYTARIWRSLASVAASWFVGSFFAGKAYAGQVQSLLKFTELKRVYDETHHVADGDKAAFNRATNTAPTQAARFGSHCDFIVCLPMPKGSQNSDNGLLSVNPENVSRRPWCMSVCNLADQPDHPRP